ncbi:hypothetical protein WN55_08913 [Dufourea novaeangliae]|uniref:Uncharacterized protein n=1 Tax=Dufourea novaeangliae TaxID=178035 RepID=A0A154P530_DUFNO|nr:hypothetical protein WN55_08913 [Dufourea novaeangliae]
MAFTGTCEGKGEEGGLGVGDGIEVLASGYLPRHGCRIKTLYLVQRMFPATLIFRCRYREDDARDLIRLGAIGVKLRKRGGIETSRAWVNTSASGSSCTTDIDQGALHRRRILQGRWKIKGRDNDSAEGELKKLLKLMRQECSTERLNKETIGEKNKDGHVRDQLIPDEADLKCQKLTKPNS